jgi:hypothetical protein
MNEKHSKREDSEYERKGTRGVFMFVEPLGGKRYACAPRRRTREDWARKLETHYTPKHGSWLNMAEIELSVINNQGLSERIPVYRTDAAGSPGVE